MTVYSFDFETGPSAAALTPANTGFSSVSMTGSGAAAVFDATHVTEGALAAKLTPIASGQNQLIKSGLASTGLAIRMPFYMTALAAADTWLFNVLNGSTRLATLHLNGAGKLRLDNAAATTGVWTATNAMPLNQWVWVNLFVIPGTTTTNGTLRATYDLGNSASPVEDSTTLTGQNTGTAGSITLAVMGKANTSNYAAVFWVDKTFVDDAATGIVSTSTPVSIAAPAAVGTGAAPGPGVSAGVAIGAPPASGSGSAPAPSVAAATVVTAPPGLGTGNNTRPAVLAAVSISPPSASGTGTAPVPAVTYQTVISFTASPPTMAGTGTAVTPTVAAATSITPPSQTATGTAPAPSVAAGTNLSAPPAAGTGQAPAPTVTYSTVQAFIASPPPMVGAGSAPSPALVLPFSAQPPAAAGFGGAPVPALKILALRDLTITAGPSLSLRSVGPSVQLTSIRSGPVMSLWATGPTSA